jgi:GDP-mannose 6-dehydrogenase
MRIAVFGLGYVGCVTGACLAKMGHRVFGVEVSPIKVKMVNQGHSPVMEKGLERLVSAGVRDGRLRATQDPAEAIRGADLSMICVGTPSKTNGEADLSHVLQAARDIGSALRRAGRFHTVVLRSTVPPGTTGGLVVPALERLSGKRVGRGFSVCFQPEFLREGSSVHDFFHPPKTVIGSEDPRGPRRLLSLWRGIAAPLFVTSLKVAEMVKYADNSFHALKIAFANEVGALANSFGVDSQEVFKIFTCDTKLNISPRYLHPGFAFGGPCLPKDLRALCSMGRKAGVTVPLLESVLRSNRQHLRRALDLIVSTGRKKVGVLGLVFKQGTDDLRESPACQLVKELLRQGLQVKVCDPRVQPEKLLGANRAFVQRELPRLPRILVGTPREVIEASDVVVLATSHPAFDIGIREMGRGKVFVDLVRAATGAALNRAEALVVC